jgi:Xaa-Pro aminopeptidase
VGVAKRSASDLNTLPPLEVAGRAGRVALELDSVGCDALIVTKLENIRYLTGFTGSAALLVVTPTALLLTTDNRYRDQSAEQLASAGVEAEIAIGNGAVQLDAIKLLCGPSSAVGLEANNVTWSSVKRFTNALGDKLVATTGVVERFRIVKDEGEQARIGAACAIADEALSNVKKRLTESPTETEFAAELEFAMRERGGQGPAFDTIVASGPNSAMPHAQPTDRVIRSGDLVVVDFGSIVDGYRSDMTRTFSVGEPSEELARLVDAVAVAQRLGVAAVAPGATGAAVDGAARASLTEAGYGEIFLHSTGHGVGLDIHEAPSVAVSATDILEPGTVVTVEPGAYVAGRAGVRIEDTLLVTDSGCRPLTMSTKDYIL